MYVQELKYRDGVLVAGSLDALVQMLIPTEKYYPEVTHTLYTNAAITHSCSSEDILVCIFTLLKTVCSTPRATGTSAKGKSLALLLRHSSYTLPQIFQYLQRQQRSGERKDGPEQVRNQLYFMQRFYYVLTDLIC